MSVLRNSLLFGHVLAVVAGLSGCATPQLESSRRSFYAGDFAQAAAGLDPLPADNRNKVLFLMERGMARQGQGNYRASIDDWSAAVEEARRIDYYSLSQGAASLLSNDEVMAFRGAPYERTLLHAFAAQNYFALGLWDDAAVEARNIIERLENLNGFPDNAYGHYLAGFCMEMINDSDGAAFQYRAAAKLLPDLLIDESTGRIEAAARAPAGAADAPAGSRERQTTQPPGQRPELICFISMGNSPSVSGVNRSSYSGASAPYAEIYSGNRLLGRSYAFADTWDLSAATETRLAAVTIVKQTSRIVIKDFATRQVSRENELLGELLRWFLFALETPDRRHWETLPRRLHVARVPCPPDLKRYRVVFKTGNGSTLKEKVINSPLKRRDNRLVSFCRDL